MKPDVILSPRDISAFSDVEGRLDLLESALDLADLPGHPERVVAALGDYVDRGPESAGVLYTLKELSAQHPGQVVVLMGNHEVDWLEWLDSDDEDYEWLAADAALVTTRSFLGCDIVADLIRSLAGSVTDPAVFAESTPWSRLQ
jgi:serine/threonine protein phosphatase 1